MAGDDKRDDQLQDMRMRVDGLAADFRMIHTQMDSMSTSLNERFDQIELAQTTAKTTLDAVVARLDALQTTLTELPKDSHGRGRHVPHHSGHDSFDKLPLKIPSYNGKYDPAAYLHWELEVEQHFSCHDIPASAQVKTAISVFSALALFWRHHEYNQKQPTTWAELKAAMRRRFMPSYYARKAKREVQGHRSTTNTNHLAGPSSTPSFAAASAAIAMVFPPPE
jgi:hypothetical protein